MRAVYGLHLLPVLFTLDMAAGRCLDRWLLFEDRCVAVYPVWASWSTAENLCSQSGSHLFSLRSYNDVEFVRKIMFKLVVPVWTGGYSAAQSDLWFWSDESDFSSDFWPHPTSGKNNSDAMCLGMESEDGEVKGAPCGEMRFYICSRQASWEPDALEEVAVARSDLVPGVSLFTVMWSYSESVAVEILHSSSFLLQLRSGSISQRCYDLFCQQEALYMGLVYKTLQALNIRDADPDVSSLLLDTKEHYKAKYSKQVPVAAPQWLQFALQSFHSVLVDDPLYLLVALSARSALNSFVFESLPLPGTVSSESKHLYQRWREESETEVQAIHRLKDVIENNQNKMDVNKSINIFRQHLMSQKNLHQNVECEE